MQTSRENPAFSDVLYIEELIGPHTINTILPATLHAFRDHRRVQRTLEAGEQDAERALARLAKLGIDLGGNHRETAGRWAFTTFTRPLDEQLASLMEKHRVLLESHAARKDGIRPCSHCVTCAEIQRNNGGSTLARDAAGPVEISPRLPALDVYAKHRAFSR